MNKPFIFVLFLGILLVVVGIALSRFSRPPADRSIAQSSSEQSMSDISLSDPQIENTVEKESILPTQEFFLRITKKQFGTFVTPERSPVQPEKFTGYHTAVDVEFDDASSPIPVFAIADGEIIQAQWVSGYGGLIVLRTMIDGRRQYIIYGHLDTSSMTQQKTVKRGEQIALLGEGYSRETDGERKHLHFGIRNDTLDIRGYVQSQAELSGWVDPIPFLEQLNVP